MSLTLTGDVASTITATATLITVIGNFVVAILQARRSRENGHKIDANTQLTKEVHAATAAIVESTGTHKALGP